MATILVIDDERLMCDFMRAVLGRQGHEVLTAYDGPSGIELYKRQRPGVTILDLALPGMSGLEVLQQLRAFDPHGTVLVLTGRGSDEAENQARALGVTDFLKKGLSLDNLMAALDRALQQSSRTAAEPGGSPVPRPEGGTGESILVVDDEAMIRNLLSEFLGMRGYRVRTAANGTEALALVDQERPQMIILDMYMPGMNGLELLRVLRSQKGYKGAVIALTASQDERLLQETLELGSVDIVAKPVDLDRLALVLQVGLTMSHQ